MIIGVLVELIVKRIYHYRKMKQTEHLEIAKCETESVVVDVE